MNLNFSISELIKSDKAKQKNIKNTPSISQVDNMLKLIFYCLQPIRDKFGAIKITSGYRCEELNKLVKGSATSNHLQGNAADIIPLNATFRQVYDFIINNLDYDECFIEKNSNGTKWLHIAFVKGRNRKKHNPNYLV